MNKKIRRLSVGALVVASLASTSAVAQDGEPIKVGFAIALSGWMANYDVEPHNAAVLKIEEINESGGLLGRQIEYKVVDMKTDQNLAATAAASLIDWGADMLIVPPDYDYGAPAALAAQNAGIVAISTGAGDPKMGVQGVGPYVFTAHTASQSQGIVIAEYGFKELGFETAYMLEDVSIEYSKSVCAGFDAAWGELGGEIVGRDTFKNDDPSIAAQITRIKGLENPPDAIFMCSYTPGGGSAVRQIRAAGVEAPVLSGTGMTGNFWLDAVPDLRDFWIPTIMSLSGDDPREEVNDFLEGYNERWGEEPSTEFSVLGYCSIEQWAQAVETAGSVEADAVVEVMNSFDEEPFTCGLTTYTDQLHIQVDRPQLIMRVEDGLFKSVGMYRNEFVPDMNLLFRVGQ